MHKYTVLYKIIQYIPDDNHNLPGSNKIIFINQMKHSNSGNEFSESEEELVPELLEVIIIVIVEIGPPGVIVRE